MGECECVRGRPGTVGMAMAFLWFSVEMCKYSGDGGEGRDVHLVQLSAYMSVVALCCDAAPCFISVALPGNLPQPKALFGFARFVSSGYLHECGPFLGYCSG